MWATEANKGTDAQGQVNQTPTDLLRVDPVWGDGIYKVPETSEQAARLIQQRRNV